MIDLIESPWSPVLVCVSPSIASVCNEVWIAVWLFHARDSISKLPRVHEDVVSLLADGTEDSLSAVDPIADIIPVLASWVPERKDFADVSTHSEVIINGMLVFGPENLDEMGEISSEDHCFSWVFQHEDVPVADADHRLNIFFSPPKGMIIEPIGLGLKDLHDRTNDERLMSRWHLREIGDIDVDKASFDWPIGDSTNRNLSFDDRILREQLVELGDERFRQIDVGWKGMETTLVRSAVTRIVELGI